MKTSLLCALFVIFTGCGRFSSSDDPDQLWIGAQKAAAVVVADVRDEGDHESYVVREAVKVSPSGQSRVAVGREIGGIGDGKNRKPYAYCGVVLMLLRETEGELKCFRMLAVKDGRILAMKGPRSDLATFITDIKKNG